MHYHAFKARSVIFWVLGQLDESACECLWPTLYLAERKCLAAYGESLIGDLWVAMRDGPVPLHALMDLHQCTIAGRYQQRGMSMDGLLLQMRGECLPGNARLMLADAEEECLAWAVGKANAVGAVPLGELARGRAWQRAGPLGEIDPLEMALEGGADAATLDHILRRDNANFLERAPIVLPLNPRTSLVCVPIR